MRLLLFALLVSLVLFFGCLGSGGQPAALAPTAPNATSPSSSGSAPGKTSPSPAQAAGTATVQISGFSFQPAELTVVQGTVIIWTNQDSVSHTATADDGTFDSGTLGQGQSWSHAFDTPGTYSYHCAIHPSMTGKIIVTG
ncbi:MAG: cupredoxin family copper-binding protein [Candidatus Micrarchaeota archaeon]